MRGRWVVLLMPFLLLVPAVSGPHVAPDSGTHADSTPSACDRARDPRISHLLATPAGRPLSLVDVPGVGACLLDVPATVPDVASDRPDVRGTVASDLPSAAGM